MPQIYTMEKNPGISIIIPLYNKVHHIANAIDSILGQTIQDFEIIIIGGKSTDGSDDIVRSYSDSRIRFIVEISNGVSAARNQGINAASANIIAFLDADDEWYPDFLETILRLMRIFPQAGMYGTAESIYTNNKLMRNVVLNPEKGERILSSYFRDYVKFGKPIFGTSCFATHKTILDDVGLYRDDLSIGEDHDLFGRIALKYPVAYSPKICARYNAASENNADKVDYYLEVPLEKHLLSRVISTNNEKNRDIWVYLDNWRLRIGARNIYSGFRKEGRKQILTVSTEEYILLKIGLLTMSYLPIPYSLISSDSVRNIMRKLDLVA